MFDVFRPQAGASSGSLASGEKSLAIRLTLESGNATLTDTDIDAAVQQVVQALAQQTGARLR
ncbi:MAG: hypothetical protein HKUEN07_36630 [Rhodocyclaceae bacterium]|nr:MAG: hypothetical protein HKUEN07_36630 [Rhodocyclaceae bacterium]